MENAEKAMGCENIQIVSPYGLTELTELQLISKPNHHTYVSFSGIIPESQKDSCVQNATTNDKIEVHQVEDGKRIQPLFKGVVTNVSVKTVRGVYFITVEALSNTYLLDIKLKSRSFQNPKMSYPELFKAVLADYPNAAATDRATGSATLKTWALQYREPDWVFLMRQASHFGAVLIPDHTCDSPRFWIGLPEGQERKIENVHFSINKRLGEYRTSSQNYAPKVAEIDYVSYKVESNQALNIGDRVKFQSVDLVIVEATAVFKQGILKFEYGLALKDAIRQNYAVHRQLAGISLPGKVIDRQKDRLRLHLQIDPKQNKEEAYWFPCATPYTAEGNSGWYWMPELNDIVYLNFPDHYESNAVVVNAQRQNGANNAKTAESDVKYLGTSRGKELQMDAGQLKFTAKESSTGKMFITLDVEAGVTIQSDQMVKITSDSDIIWDAKTISIHSAEGVYLGCQQSSAIIDGAVDLKADQVRVVGLVPPVDNSNNSNSEREQEDKPKTEQETGQSETHSDSLKRESDFESNESSSEETPADEDEAEDDILGVIPKRVK